MRHYGLSIVTPPASEPVSIAEVKEWLKIESDVTEDNGLINGLILAATEMAESYLNRSLITRTYDLTMDCFPPDYYGVVYMPKNPVQSITSVKYIDNNGTLQTWDAGNYTLDNSGEQARLTAAYNISYPNTRDVINAVIIRYVAGYGDADSVPENFKTAIKVMVAEMYNNRQETVYGVSVNRVSMTAQYLLGNKRLAGF